MKTLYKFRNWTTEKDFPFVSSVISGKLWFPVAFQVNDPFEFRCAVDFLYDRESSIKSFTFIERREKPFLSEEQAEENVRRVFSSLSDQRIRERQWEISYQLWRYLSNSVSMCSLSSDPEHALLWSHYAGGHSGVAVEIEMSALEKSLYKVSYSNKIPKIPAYALIDTKSAIENDLFGAFFLRKAECWSYESEYRLMIMRADAHSEAMPAGSVRRVIIGCAMPDEKKAMLLRWMDENAPNVEIAYALPFSSSGYGLRILTA